VDCSETEFWTRDDRQGTKLLKNDTTPRLHALIFTMYSSMQHGPFLQADEFFNSIKKFSSLRVTRRLIIIFTGGHCWSLIWDTCISQHPPNVFFKEPLLYYSNPRLCLPNGLFHADFLTKSMCELLTSSHIERTHQTHSYACPWRVYIDVEVATWISLFLNIVLLSRLSISLWWQRNFCERNGCESLYLRDIDGFELWDIRNIS
jgi:hypothetical protein